MAEQGPSGPEMFNTFSNDTPDSINNRVEGLLKDAQDDATFEAHGKVQEANTFDGEADYHQQVTAEAQKIHAAEKPAMIDAYNQGLRNLEKNTADADPRHQASPDALSGAAAKLAENHSDTLQDLAEADAKKDGVEINRGNS